LNKIIVIGSSGFVGNAICNQIFKTSSEIITINRNQFSKIKLLPSTFRNSVEPSDVIVFAAAKAPAKTSLDFLENMILVREFMELIDGTSFAYLLNISSDAVYGDYFRPIVEEDSPQPTSIHGLMHYSREFLLNELFGDRMGNLRPTLIYGPRDPHNGYGPNRFIRQALKNEPIEVFGNGEEQRDHIFIEDVANIAQKMIELKYVGNVNAASGQTHSFATIANYVKSQFPKSQIITKSRSQSHLPHNGYRAFNVSKLLQVVPGMKLHNITSGIDITLSSENKNGN
jgi:UDP-glucose 4-epimerase